MEDAKQQFYKNRLFVANLIRDVVLEKITVLDAISNFPKDKNDINIKCAFDALVHREADEELRKSVEGYKEVQDEYLIGISNILRKNQLLPKNVILKYFKFHTTDLISPKINNYKDVFNKIKRMINF